MDFEAVVNSRRSVHHFQSGVEIPKEHLTKMVEAAMQAPNMANRRPWEFYVVTDRAIIEEIVMEHPSGKGWRTASALIILCACPDLQQPLPEDFLPLDCAAAQSYLLLAATNLGYGSCWVGLYPDTAKVEAVQELLGCESLPFSAAVIGLPAEQPHPRIAPEPEKIHFI